jgi:hypothetical protein
MLRNAVRIILMAALPTRLAAIRLVPMCLVPMCLLPLCIGCAMCGSQDDYTYAAFGGRWQRDDPINGRVGSAFAPAGAMVVGEGVTGDEQTQQPKLNNPEGDDGSPEASDAEEVYGEALSEAEEGKGDGSDSDAVTDAAENGSMTDISAPSNSTVGPQRSARSVVH